MTLGSPKRPRIGIPWRTSREESEQNRPKMQNYEDAVREAGGEPVLLSLLDEAKLKQQFATCVTAHSNAMAAWFRLSSRKI